MKIKVIELVIASLSLLLLFSAIPLSAQDTRGERVFDPNPVKIDVSRKEEFRVLFPYSNPFSDRALDNVIAEVTLSGNGFEIVKESNFDLYDSSGNKKADCTDPNSVPKYPISVSTLTPSSFIYGLQSSKSLDTPSGQIKSVLPAGATGCILVSLKVLENAVVGQKGQLRFNWYIEDETNVKNQPIIGVYNFEIVSATSNTANVCSITQELSDGICREICSIGYVRNNLGTCVEQSTLNTITNSQSNQSLAPVEDFRVVVWLLSISIALFALSIILVIIAILNYKKYR
jgi:hypothetical protein